MLATCNNKTNDTSYAYGEGRLFRLILNVMLRS